MKNSILLILSALFLFTACNKDKMPIDDSCPGDLPCIDGNSDEFLAAYANGEPWISRSDASFAGLHEIEASFNTNNNNNFLTIQGRREFSEFSDVISFGTKNLTLDSEMVLNVESENYRDYNSPCIDAPDGSFRYYGDSTYNNSITLFNFDLDTQIAEGEFAIGVVNPTCNDTITFDQGRFSIHFWIQ